MQGKTERCMPRHVPDRKIREDNALIPARFYFRSWRLATLAPSVGETGENPEWSRLCRNKDMNSQAKSEHRSAHQTRQVRCRRSFILAIDALEASFRYDTSQNLCNVVLCV
jgi:hypothetical protein